MFYKWISAITTFIIFNIIGTPANTTIKTLKNYLEIADKLKRTVEGVLYDTESEANEIRHDIEVFNNILDDKNIFDNDSKS